MKISLREFRKLVRSALAERLHTNGLRFMLVDNDGRESMQSLQDLSFELGLMKIGHQVEIDGSMPGFTLRLHVRKVNEGRYRVKANVLGRENDFGKRSERELIDLVRNMIVPAIASNRSWL